ncbi:hypothetical protein N7489_003700, partial [Penicillium chrysogenum]|uniref:uncharacterized protein n=1 Tax=Penicillium chrysogenum TaxID=5076 RepID=UPI0024DF22BC
PITPTSSPPPKIKDVVVNILNTLEVIDHANLTESEILDLGVSAEGFDPSNEDPETPWLFMPISKEDIKPGRSRPLRPTRFEEFAGGNEGFLKNGGMVKTSLDLPSVSSSAQRGTVRKAVYYNIQSELGSTAQVVAFRRTQPGFETYRLFLVR